MLFALLAIVAVGQSSALRPSVGLQAKVVDQNRCQTDDVHGLGKDENSCVFEANLPQRSIAQITLADSGRISLGPGGFFNWKLYRNNEYWCGDSGNFTFLVIEPRNIEGRPPADLWVFMHGGGSGWFYDNGTYSKSTFSLHEEDADRLLEETFGRFITPWPMEGGIQPIVQNNTMLKRLLDGYRVMAVSMCDHDYHMGQGTEEVNNPAPELRRRQVDGQLAVLSAIDFTLDRFPTGNFWIHGVSAGSFGAWPVTFILASEGNAPTGVILDSALRSDAFYAVVGDEAEGQESIDAMATKSGWWADPATALTVAEAVGGGFNATAILDVYGILDPLCGGLVDAHPLAVDAGFDNNCLYMHASLAGAIVDANPNLHFALPDADGGHVVSFRPALSPQIEDWVAAVLIANPSPLSV